MKSDLYFAAKAPDETASILMGKMDAWTNSLETNGYLDKLRKAWSAYYGAYYSDVGSGHQLSFGGAEGEIVNLPVNHIGNLGRHILVMTTSTRPAMEARATNTDYKSLTQTLLANGLLDYYMREKRMEKYLKAAVESAIVLGSGYIKMAWNATSGEMYEFNEETGTPIYEGDVEFTNLSPFDVVVDSTKESSSDHDWIICRSWKNRYDIAAKYPELRDQIMSLPTKSEMDNAYFYSRGQEDTEDVAVYEFFHRRTESLPEGRYLMFLSDKVTPYDGPLPYRTLPIYRISPSDIMGTPFGYTTIFDLLPLQEALNSLFSTILSNQSAFGVQNIIVPRGADIAVSQLSGGLNIIEANMAAGKPESLNLTDTPAEIFKFLDILKQEMETLSGVNSVARGQPEASLKSGAALALIQSMAIQFMSGLQQSYVQMIEDVGTALIMMLRDFAAVPRVAAIVGKSNRCYMKEFKGDDLSNVNRVIVDVGNALARTTAGRVEMANQMLQMNLIKTPEQYITVINTGRLDTMIESSQSQLLLAKGENEKMMRGEPVPIIAIDEHKLHINEHAAILADPDLRMDPELTQIVLGHIQEHIEALRSVNPDLLMTLNQQPLAPPQPPAPPPGAPADGSLPPPGGEMVPPEVTQQLPPGAPGLPQVPSPPAPFNNLPTNPANVPLQ